MLVMDMPDVPQYAQVIVVQAGAAKQGAAKFDRTLGVCQVIENRQLPGGGPDISAINSISPGGWVKNYFSQQERRKVESPERVTVLQNAAHGTVKAGEGESYLYIPAAGYFGRDRAVLLVEMDGMKIRIVYTFHVLSMVDGNETLCPRQHVWKISLSTDINPLASQGSVQVE